MKQYNFQDWLNRKVSDDPEVILAGKLEYLRLYLTDAMRELRTKAGLTQAELAEKLGVQQAAVSKLESALKDHELESVLHYLHTLGADLLVAVKQGEELYQVSDNEGVVLVDIPMEVAQDAEGKGMNLREYVHAAIQHFSHKGVSVIKSGTTFLKSDDPVAVRVRHFLGFRSIPEVVAQLEQIYRTCPENEWRYAGGDVLAGSVQTLGSERESSDEDADIELQDLAESLLEKLAKIWGNQN